MCTIPAIGRAVDPELSADENPADSVVQTQHDTSGSARSSLVRVRSLLESDRRNRRRCVVSDDVDVVRRVFRDAAGDAGHRFGDLADIVGSEEDDRRSDLRGDRFDPRRDRRRRTSDRFARIGTWPAGDIGDALVELSGDVRDAKGSSSPSSYHPTSIAYASSSGTTVRAITSSSSASPYSAARSSAASARYDPSKGTRNVIATVTFATGGEQGWGVSARSLTGRR